MAWVLKNKRSVTVDVFFILEPTHMLLFDFPTQINRRETIQSSA